MSKINYTATSHPSGVVVAPMQPIWFIQRLSRQGKSEGHWVYTTPLFFKYGCIGESHANARLKLKQADTTTQYRKVLTNVYI